MSTRIYIAIDLKSFYASVECIERNLDPLTTNLVVADSSRTERTICLAVSPSLKAYGIPGRPRLFEVIQRVRDANELRRRKAPYHKFTSESYDTAVLQTRPDVAIGYIKAVPRMALYIKYSTDIYKVYTSYISPDDIHVYSIDEVFIDATPYLRLYKQPAHDLAMTIIKEVLKRTGITATAGIGSNMYLCKVAMDIVAKKAAPDKDGVRIAEIDEMSYRRLLWEHQPITDFWRVGKGYAQKLAMYGIKTMGDLARFSLRREDLLYQLFGVNAELLIDHAWGVEPCTIADIKAYQPASRCLCSGQVLHDVYSFDKARLVLREMGDALALDLLEKQCITSQLVLTVGYDITNLTDSTISCYYQGEVVMDSYGRKKPKHAHGTINLSQPTSSAQLLTTAIMELYDRIVDEKLLIRRLTLSANNVIEESRLQEQPKLLSLMDTLAPKQKDSRDQALQAERKRQEAMLSIRSKYGKNAILKGTSFEEGATGRERHNQIGGHKA